MKPITEDVKDLERSGLFSKEELEFIVGNLDLYVCWGDEGVQEVVGLTPNNVGEVIGKRGETVRRWIKTGKVKGYKTLSGYMVLVPVDEIINLKRKA